MLGNWKARSIPWIYLIASESVRAQVLAGRLDTDGTPKPNKGRHYCFTQCDKHRQLLDDAYRLAEGLGIRVGKIGSRPAYGPYDSEQCNGTIDYFILSRPALIKLQPYILLPRKRLRHTRFSEREGRSIRVEEVSELREGRTIQMPGREAPLVQLEGAYIIRKD